MHVVYNLLVSLMALNRNNVQSDNSDNQGHRAMFIHKFHCELNPIERVWCHTKHYTCSHCDYSFPNKLLIQFWILYV